MVVRDYILLTLFIKVPQSYPTAVPFLPNSHQPKQNWADSGTTEAKSTKPSPSLPWLPYILTQLWTSRVSLPVVSSNAVTVNHRVFCIIRLHSSHVMLQNFSILTNVKSQKGQLSRSRSLLRKRKVPSNFTFPFWFNLRVKSFKLRRFDLMHLWCNFTGR